MSDAPPIAFVWQGDGFKPASPAWGRLADRFFVVGQRYEIVEHLERSSASHRHLFAAVQEAWSNLPEDQAERFPSSEHLRKHALIKAGFCDTQTHVCGTIAEAQRLERALKPVDEFSLLERRGCVVTRYVAHSQSMRAMGKETFQKSKDEVLRIVAEMIGTTPEQLAKAAA